MKQKDNTLTLVVNLSLSRMKIAVISASGTVVYRNWLPLRTFIRDGYVEQDPNEWWGQLSELFDKLAKQKDISSTIGSVTVTSSSLCLVAIDRKGEVVGQSLMVSDKRAEKEARLLHDRFADFFQEHPSCKADPSFMLPKIWWMKRNERNLFRKVARFVSSNDFLIYRLTGKVITDELNAEKFYYDSIKKSYPLHLLSAIGITKRMLPEVVPPGTIIGALKKELAKRMGAMKEIICSVSTYDAICAFIGSSTWAKEELTNVCGTCSSYRIFLPEKFTLGDNTLLSQNFTSENLRIVGGSNNLEGGVLEWAKECFYGESYLKDDTFLYSLMQKEAEESKLGANGIVFIPYLLGERVPFLDPDVRGMFFGIERYHRRRDIIRSVFESTGFQARLMIDAFEKNGIVISSVIMSGGVAKMDTAVQIRSDISGLPIRVLEEVETTALGAFILNQKARGKIKSIKEAKGIIRVKKTFMPNMHHHNAYSSLYLLYRQLYTANREFFKKRREINTRISTYQEKVLENL